MAKNSYSMLLFVENQVMYCIFSLKYVILKKLTEGVSQQPQSKKSD